jgi:chemotaxis protein MotB
MARNSGRRRMGAEEEAEESDERWLLTYADMITLLMALFMVLFSISSVNVSKFVTL